MLMSMGNDNIIHSGNVLVSHSGLHRKKIRRVEVNEGTSGRCGRDGASSPSPTHSSYFNNNVIFLSHQFPHVHCGLISSLLEIAAGDVSKTSNLIRQLEECSNLSERKTSGSDECKRHLKRSTRDWDTDIFCRNDGLLETPCEGASEASKSHVVKQEGDLETRNSLGTYNRFHEKDTSNFDVSFSSPHAKNLPEHNSDASYEVSSSGRHLIKPFQSSPEPQGTCDSPSKRSTSRGFSSFLSSPNKSRELIKQSNSRQAFTLTSSSDSLYKGSGSVERHEDLGSSSVAFGCDAASQDSLNLSDTVIGQEKQQCPILHDSTSQYNGLRNNLKLLSYVVVTQHDKIVQLRAQNAELLKEANQAKASLQRSTEELRQCREANLALQYYLSSSNRVKSSEFESYCGATNNFEFSFNRRPDVF